MTLPVPTSPWTLKRRPSLLLLLLRLPRLQHDVACAHVALDAETEALLARAHLHRLAELFEVPADLLELRRWHPRDDLVVLLRNLHVLALDLHQLQVEISDPVVLTALALEAHVVGVVLPLELQRIVRPAHLEDFRQRVDVHSERGGPVALEFRKRGLPEHQ